MTRQAWYHMNNMDEKTEKGIMRMLTQLLGVVVIVAVFLIVFGRMSGKTGVNVTEGGIVLTDLEGGTAEIIYADITELELIALPEDYGECIEGGSKGGFTYGMWKNDAWGSYRLCVKDKVPEAILVRQGDGLIIFNYEGDESTESFFAALHEQLQ